MHEQGVSRIRAVDTELEHFIPLFLQLLSIPSEKYALPKHLEGNHFGLAMTDAISALFTLKAKSAPVVILLEDWHWADEASRDVLKQIAEMVSNYSLLVVATYRPEQLLDWGNPASHTATCLRPLEITPSIDVMKSVTGAKEFSKELAQHIYERTGGNPFFLEEVCRTLLEENTLKFKKGRGILNGSLETLQLPNTVQAVIRTRLDRMDRTAREVLCAASVISQEFILKVLQHILPDHNNLVGSLETLRTLGLIQQIKILPEITYRFKHVLTQKVAYESLLIHQRKELHKRVGQTIENLYPDQTGEQANILRRFTWSIKQMNGSRNSRIIPYIRID